MKIKPQNCKTLQNRQSNHSHMVYGCPCLMRQGFTTRRKGNLTCRRYFFSGKGCLVTPDDCISLETCWKVPMAVGVIRSENHHSSIYIVFSWLQRLRSRWHKTHSVSSFDCWTKCGRCWIFMDFLWVQTKFGKFWAQKKMEPGSPEKWREMVVFFGGSTELLKHSLDI